MYVDTMARTVHGLFKQYHADLASPKLLLPGLGKHDLIAADEAGLKSLFTKKVDLSKRAGLSLGDRARQTDAGGIDALIFGLVARTVSLGARDFLVLR